MKHAHPIQFTAINNKRLQEFTLWDGEMLVTVQQSVGAHGFYSAAIVVEHMDSPMECRLYEGYNRDIGRENRNAQMRFWIAKTLNDLATGVNGTCSIVEGTEEALRGVESI